MLLARDGLIWWPWDTVPPETNLGREPHAMPKL